MPLPEFQTLQNYNFCQKPIKIYEYLKVQITQIFKITELPPCLTH
jgi:hypothetical protein